MSERDFTIGLREFKLLKIDTFKQFHIARRLMPIMGDIMPLAKKLKDLEKEDLSEDAKFDAIATLAQPIMNGIAKLSDEDANLVLLGLCSSVEMKQMPIGNWARVANDKAGLMFHDLELPELLQIAGRSFIFNIARFFPSAPQASLGK
jgi:hypothetical protein